MIALRAEQLPLFGLELRERKPRRVYHHYSKWEDANAGVWRKAAAAERPSLLGKAAEFMADTEQFRSFARRVVLEWRYTVEHNLTDTSINRVAWLGHAAVVMATGCPEEVTREAWWTLSREKRDAADAAVASVIVEWEGLSLLGMGPNDA